MRELEFKAQLAHDGSVTKKISDFANVKELYQRLAEAFNVQKSEVSSQKKNATSCLCYWKWIVTTLLEMQPHFLFSFFFWPKSLYFCGSINTLDQSAKGCKNWGWTSLDKKVSSFFLPQTFERGQATRPQYYTMLWNIYFAFADSILHAKYAHHRYGSPLGWQTWLDRFHLCASKG